MLDDHYNIFPLGDCASTIELGKLMNAGLNKKVLAMQKWFYENSFNGLMDTIVAYTTLTIIYDPNIIRKNYLFKGTVWDWIGKKLELAYKESSIQDSNNSMTRIPVCYDEEFGFDLQEVSRSTNLSVDEIIDLHISKIYRVYMLGFLPGFAYLGEIEPRLVMPRKETPVAVQAGSVGIVSNQTGIYPLNSPGGWQIIGRTPLKLFEPKNVNPVKLKAGDEVQFYRITREEFEKFEA